MVSFLWSYAFKDLGRNRTRSMLGIFGVAVSIFLLTTVSFLTDSISNSFVDFLTTDSGNQDIVLSARHHYGEEANRSDYFEFQEIIDQIEANVSEIEHFFPRAVFNGYTNGSAVQLKNTTYRFSLTAMDIKKEDSAGFGKFFDLSEGVNIAGGLPVNTCMISLQIAAVFSVAPGDVISLKLNELNATVNLTVHTTFTHSLKFPAWEDSEVIVDLSWWGDVANAVDNGDEHVDDWNGRANMMIMQIVDGETIYDIRDIDGSEEYISGIGASILYTIGIEAWNLDYPKLEYLFISEYLSMTMNVLFMIISFVSMLISGILINGILTTSVEEKIREYGINRVLGARKAYNLKLILIQASILTFFGTTIGMLSSGLLVKYVALPYIETLIPDGIISNSIDFVAQPQSIIVGYAIGFGVSMVVSISPALKVMKMKIVDAINPYRSSESVYKLQKDSSANVKLIMFGTVLAANGMFIYFLLPRVFLSMNIGLIAGTLIGTLLLFLVGVSLLAIGLMPILIRLLTYVFQPFAKKVMNIIKITVYRHQRRNLSTIVMFVLSFSFIMFTTSMVEIQTKQVGAMIQYTRGSDLQVIPTSFDINCPTVALQEQLNEIEGIERTSALLAGYDDLNQIYGSSEKEFKVTLGDYINFKKNNIHLYGIDEYYQDTVYSSEYIAFTEGDSDEAFEKVFEFNTTNVIISAALSNAMDLHLGDSARLTFTRGTEEEAVVATIVGVAKNMPGLNRFKEQAFQVQNGGVICSAENYIRYFNIPGDNNAFIDRIFVKVREGYDPKDVENSIYDLLGDDSNFMIRNTASSVEGADEDFVVIKYIFLLILIGTVLIGLFGLISSAYSSIIERRREIAILRTLGLYPDEVNKMFLIETTILFLSSGTSGGLIGYLMAFILSETMTIFTETPRIIAVPWDIVGIIYGVSLLFLYFGMKKLMKRVKSQNLIEIYRETL